jgi:hypothetical protein
MKKGQIDLFHREYLNEILSSETASFRRDYFHYVAEKDLVKRVEADAEEFKTFLTIDPAYTVSSTSDYTTFCVTYTDENNVLYVEEILRGHWTITDTLNVWFDLVEKFKPDRQGIQKIDWNRSFKTPLMTEQKRRGVHFIVTELQMYSPKIKGLQSKKHRIERLAPRYAAGQVFHITHNGELSTGLRVLEDELLSHPRSKHDDAAD